MFFFCSGKRGRKYRFYCSDKGGSERGHRAGKRDRNLCSRLWMCEEARGISFTFRWKKPGVYSLHFGARTQEAINAAGGFSEKANQTAWNLAEVLQDGMQVYIPSKDEAKEALNEEQSLGKDLSASQKEDTVNINTASKEELMTLPGIGESRADAVIACREEKGSFTSIEGIKDAAGIGDGIFNRIKDLITVN